MLVRDVMTKNPVTASVDTSLAAAMELLFAEDFRHLPVLSGRELVGMLSDRDVRQFSRVAMSDSASAKAQLRAPISKLMSGDVLAVDEEDDLDAVIDLMLENKVGAVPVVDTDGTLTGIVSYVDILRAASGKL